MGQPCKISGPGPGTGDCSADATRLASPGPSRPPLETSVLAQLAQVELLSPAYGSFAAVPPGTLPASSGHYECSVCEGRGAWVGEAQRMDCWIGGACMAKPDGHAWVAAAQ